MKTLLPIFLGLFSYALTFAQPANDLCSSAIPLAVNGSCVEASLNNNNATDSGETPNPSCGTYQGEDVWFSVVVPASGKLTIEANAGAFEPAISLYSGSCGTLTLVTCNADGPVSLDNRTIIHDNNLAGMSLFVRMFAVNGANTGNYKICAYESNSPSFDYCSGREQLGFPPETPGAFIEYDASFVTGDATPGSIGCGATQADYHDAWLSVIVPPSGTVTIETKAVNKPIISVYEGDCSNLVLVGCNFSNGGSTLNYNNPGNAGQELYIRIMFDNSKFGDMFRMRVFDTEPVPLPVELIFFDAHQKDQQMELTWATASEINNSHFDIQHSVDGETWRALGLVHGNGNSATEINYSFIHNFPSFGENYYRIRQVDFDGTFDYSEIKVVEFDSDNIIRIWPIPSKGNFTLELSPDAIQNKDVYTITIHNSEGQLIMEKQIDNTLSEWVLPDTYPSGYYWISANNRLKQIGTLVLIQRE